MLKYLHLVAENSDRAFQMGTTVFNCGTLQSLKLKGYMLVSAAIPVCLPRLESLKLDSVCFQSEEAFEKLITECPMLKYLHVRINIPRMTKCLQTYDGDENCVFKFVVSSTSLRRLKLYVEFVDEEEEDCLHSNLELEASSLEYLKLVGHITRIHVQESLSSLVEADFGIKICQCEWNGTGVGKSFTKALHAFRSVKALTLSEESLWALKEALNDTIPDRLTTKFKRLVKLTAGAACCYTNVFQDLMQNSDSLEVLTLDDLITCGGDGRSYDEDHVYWSPPKEVPRCLSNSLKTVEFTCYVGSDYERELVGYMLEHGSVLEVMKLSCDSYRKDCKYELLQEICNLPRKSPTCKIELSG